MGSTNLNLLLDVGFNKEVALDAALYWTKEDGNLAKLIDYADELPPNEIEKFGNRAKERVKTAYSWNYICKRYRATWSRLIRKKRIDLQ